MTNEQLRLQMLSGIITESEYKAKLEESKSTEPKDSLNENFVGMGMVGNIFDRKKTDYELAFEHFSKESLSENEIDENNDSEKLNDNRYDFSLGDITKIVNAFTDFPITSEMVKEEIELNHI